jgi:hypothetical protein
MGLQITTEMIFSKLNEERSKGEMTPLQKEFYSSAEDLIGKLEAEASKDTSQKQAENTKRMLESLKEKRRQKLLIYLAYGKPLPQPMPEEEEGLYNEIRRILCKSEEKSKTASIRILSDIPEVFTSEGRKIGPYKQGDVVEVPDNSDAEFMIKNKIGEPITR